jgi:hypothetical protein
MSSKNIRHDAETGALLNDQPQPVSSASNWKDYLDSPAYHDHPLAYLPSLHILVGGIGSGKSTAIYGILAELDEIMKPERRGRVMYYSGSPSDRILDSYDDAAVEKFGPPSKESFLTAVRELLGSAADVPPDKRKHNIIVLDDIVNDKDLNPASMRTESPIAKLLTSMRHLPATVIMASQKMTSLPTFARANFGHGYFFRTKSDAERGDILRSVNFSKGEFTSAMDSLNEAGDFLWLNQHRRTIVKGWTRGLCH